MGRALGTVKTGQGAAGEEGWENIVLWQEGKEVGSRDRCGVVMQTVRILLW